MGTTVEMLYSDKDINREARKRAEELSARPSPGRTLYSDEINIHKIKTWPVIPILLGAIVASFVFGSYIQAFLG